MTFNYTKAKFILETEKAKTFLAEGTICTPFPLVDEILDKLDIDWSNPALTFLDPVCGRGTFLVAILNRLLEAGHTQQWIVENMLFGMDIEEKNAAFVRSILGAAGKYHTNIECCDSLTKDWNMKKFDVVVGNPPYQEGDTGSNKTLFDEFYYLAADLADQVAFVAPTMWLLSSKKSLVKLRSFLVEHGLVEVVELNASKVFGVNINMLGYTIQDKAHATKTYTIRRLSGDVVESTGAAAPVMSSDTLVHSILAKLSTGEMLGAVNSQLRGIGKDGTCSNGEASAVETRDHRFKMINKVNGGELEYAWTKVAKNVHAGSVRVVFGDLSSKMSLGVVSVLTDTASTTSRSVVYVPVESHTHGESLKSYLDSKLFRFVLPLRRPGTNNAVGLLNQLSRPPLTHNWTNAELYKHFNLTQEEIDLIESTVK